MILRRIQHWRDARAVARRPIPDDLWKRTLKRYPFLRRRDRADEDELRRLSSLFLDRKEFTAVGRVRLTNDVVVAVAAQACLPVLRIGLEAYGGFIGIVLHADAVVARRQVHDEDGLVHEYDEVLSGEAMQGGPLMLSWRDVRTAGQSAEQGYNVVIHEFAHVLDMTDGLSSESPRLPAGIEAAHWRRTLASELERLQAAVERDEPTTLDPYGAEAPEEFFAVASESFFVAPQSLRHDHAALYALLASYYRQDPAADAAGPG
ncbi:MAG: zinc-dependent peptidase [Rubrivivax sp.]|nr:zinc-dependent peptidase [Rubrivivax sp.]